VEKQKELFSSHKISGRTRKPRKKKYVAQLKESEEKLKELNASKDKFFSIIAHDIKNPFVSIIGYSELIAVDCLKLDTSELKEFAENLHKEAKIIYDLLENLLT
jgi:signal transduction histidine kinase